MYRTVTALLRSLLVAVPAGLARLGVVDRDRGEAIFDLALPVMVTGGLRTLVSAADFFMVSLAVGSAAVAGLQFGFQYYFVVIGLSLAISSGTISVVSRFYGAGEHARANLALKQALWLALVIAGPFALAGLLWSRTFIGLLTDDPQVIALGGVYLEIVMASTPFSFWNMAGSRALAGAGDTRTPMLIRATTLPTNLVLNALLIFGLGPFPRLGIVGAAVGTVIANVLSALIQLVVLLSGRFAIRLPIRGQQVDLGIMAEIVRVGLPLSGTRLAQSAARFPFLFVLGALGTNVVAAYAIGRRLMQLAMMPAWGFGTAASTLVGQAIGGGDDVVAEAYGWESVRIALATQLLIAAVLFAAARPLAELFGAEHVSLTVEFIYVFGVVVAGISVRQTLQGALRGAGDTMFPFYGTMAGNYLVRLPVALVALPVGVGVTVLGYSVSPGLGIGLPAVYVGIWGDIYVRAAVNWLRFRSGTWKAIARRGAARAGMEAD